MEGKYTWNAQKKELWTLSIKELKDKLTELEKDKLKMETSLRMDGHSMKRYGYHSIDKKRFMGGSLKQIKKAIACIKTMISKKEDKNE